MGAVRSVHMVNHWLTTVTPVTGCGEGRMR